VRTVKVVERDGEKRVYLEVAYGTSNVANYSYADLVIGNSTDLVEMGLPQVTIFQLGRTVTIPWAEEWIGTLEGHGPGIGRLSPKYCEYLAHLQSRKPPRDRG